MSVTTTASLALTLGLTGTSSAAVPTAQGGIVAAGIPGGAASGALASTATSSGVTSSAAAASGSTATVVNGDVYTNRFGPVQVQATFAADGSLSSVDAIQWPSNDGKSVRINDRAVPVLNSEALSAQSARVDTVSGATYTSAGYTQSLQSAIDEARVAGLTSLA